MRNVQQFVAALVLPVFLVACGGGSGGSDTPSNDNDGGNPIPPETAQGVFLDNAVEGLSFTSGDQSGFTDNKGTFTYEVGKEVRFNIGDIILGAVLGKAIITPLDLVSGGGADEADPAVVNMLRFLQSIDDDNDLSNGILITETVRTLSQNRTINFIQSLNDFTNDGNVQTLVSELTAATNAGPRNLVDPDVALAHFRVTLAEINGTTPTVTEFTLTLSGDDTSFLGTELVTGPTIFVESTEFVPAGIIVFDRNVTIDGEDIVSVADPDNTFTAVLSTVGVSMTIIREGIEYGYACNTEFEVNGVFIDCGDYTVDLENRTVSFNDVTVENTDTESILTINGTLLWNE